MIRPQRADSPALSNRTADHHARVQERRDALRETLREILPSNAPLIWEVGCGHGHFLTAYAGAHLEQFCVGIDIVRDRVERATRKRNRARLPRLHFVLAEAHEFLDALPGAARFSAIYVLFPDPWPKRRHHKNRLMRAAFLDAIAQRASPGARVYFRTDFEPYFLEVAAVMQAHAAWELIEEPWPFENETVFQARASNYYSLIARKRP